jgi:predicted DNA-binding transcriptional regulator AlpA
MNHSEGTAETDALIRPASDRLISIADIRLIFKLGRTAAYELTHRQGFPDPVEISPRCYRWWAREVDEFAAALRRPRAQARTRPEHEPAPDPAIQPRRISGTARPIRSRKAPS